VDGLDELIVPLLSPDVLAHFDVIGFDPRGVGRSAPVHCETGPELDQYFNLEPAPTTAAGLAKVLAAAMLFDQRCEADSGPLLPFVGTVNAARDMEEIRIAVGDPRFNYFGFS
jgi:pimeloyl-ACP methyl ester carboxylesterase